MNTNTNEITSIFTKEQYLAIRASWKQFIADGRHKKYKVEQYHSHINKAGESVKAFYWKSDLEAVHHYVYALIRRRDPSTIFSEDSLAAIQHHVAWLRNRSSEYDLSRSIKPLLAPFGESFSFDDFKKLTA